MISLGVIGLANLISYKLYSEITGLSFMKSLKNYVDPSVINKDEMLNKIELGNSKFLFSLNLC